MKKALPIFIAVFLILSGSARSLHAQIEEVKELPVTEKAAQNEEKEKKPKYEAQFIYSSESLSRGLGTWRTAAVYFERRFTSRRIVWAQYRSSDRRGIRDQEFIGGFYQPLKNKWAVTGEAMYSPTKKFVGRFSVMGEVEKVLPKGYVAHFGARHTSYTSVRATTLYGLGEKYWGQNRVAYTLFVTNLSNAGTAPSHRFQYNRYFGERVNTIGVAVSYGREHENVGPGLGIMRSKTWSVYGSLRYWINDRFGITADGGVHRQGDLYYRKGLTIGVRFRF